MYRATRLGSFLKCRINRRRDLEPSTVRNFFCRIPEDEEQYITFLYNLWFTRYPGYSGSMPGSSAFEHHYMHEIKNGNICGFHNWIYFLREESMGRLDYKGFRNLYRLGAVRFERVSSSVLQMLSFADRVRA